MKRTSRFLMAGAAVALLGACAPTMGLPRALPLPTVAVRADPGTDVATAAAAIRAASPRIALVAGPADTAWFSALAGAVNLRLSGPALVAPDMGIAFLGFEAVGDTTVTLEHDRGAVVLHDALYEVREQRYLDLLAFRVDEAIDVGPVIRAVTAYLATDVMPNVAVVLAVVVPSAEVGDAIARALTPIYFDARRCGADPADAAGVRLFYGPEAQVYCETAAAASDAAGDRVEARLVMGRRVP